ncbi:site-specific recombinase [Acinetobacter sp. NIPH 1958]|uniref:site-specific recombinase n=1 Tax=unclassified Acinetobacter TaxID=196816 RepID=UPI001F4AD81C|nr:MULTISPECIES: site-specific recombinase [unclassified Acinetobacter]MCH7350621.1 site-specific recombinase [Acinetobacter sp. NIPH 2023]MCH7355259.1 site-specific recombinase [Acinetobacter sp. NIPH 1958]MCH7357739.1 site-specific recombinase [Acinetobacter sp. NIPH 2024]
MHLTLSDLFSNMQEQLDHPQAVLDENLLIEFVNRIRPKNPNDADEVKQRIHALIKILLLTPTSAILLQNFLLKLISQYKQLSLYADSGILSLDGFWNQLSQRLGAHFLPLVEDGQQLKTLIGKVFHQENDSEWLDLIENQDWITLFNLLGESQSNTREKQVSKNELIKAITVLSYRISGIGLYPEFINAQPEITEYESPFLVQNREIVEFIEKYKKQIDDQDAVVVLPPPDASQAFVMLDQCREVVLKIRRATKRIGVSISLTYLLSLLEQAIDRIELLLTILASKNDARYTALGELITDLTKAHYNEKSVRHLLTSTSELIALQVTENASKTGEHYVSTDKAGFFGMYKAAAGAGAIIATMATLKILTARLVLAPFGHAFLYSMNYALGFMLIHVLHFTVATKQPAMTAAALASTVQQQKGSKTAQIAELAALIINIIRTQFIAILGNISIAIPTAALITFLWQYNLGEPLLNHTKSAALLHSLNPFTSLAIPHAAIAGVCLFFSGLIAGYFDNLAVYRKVGPRLKQHRRLKRWMGQQRLDKFAAYIETNLGALAGNFLFGIMLGSMGTIGFILGLPLDIRHIAFASANFIQGLMTIGGPDIGLILVSFLGVMLIGLTNLFVSFTLTIIVALRARRVRFAQWKPLAKLVITHFLTRPSDFFWPPKQPVEVEEQTKNASSHH